MKIKIKIEGTVDISTIEDLFEALGVPAINLTKSERLKEIKEVAEIEETIKKEVTSTIAIEITIKELIIRKDGTYTLTAES